MSDNTTCRRLNEVPTYKNYILDTLLDNDNIVKALGNKESNFLDVASISRPKDLLFTQIYPWAFVPDPDDEQNV